MQTGTGCFPVFRFHVVSARYNRAGDVREQAFAVGRGDPCSRVIAVVIVAVHYNAVRRQKVLAGTLIMLESTADIVILDRIAKCFSVRDLPDIGIGFL